MADADAGNVGDEIAQKPLSLSPLPACGERSAFERSEEDG
jgi:hypothetical protein